MKLIESPADPKCRIVAVARTTPGEVHVSALAKHSSFDADDDQKKTCHYDEDDGDVDEVDH